MPLYCGSLHKMFIVKTVSLILNIILLQSTLVQSASIKYTNVKCVDFDKTFSEIKECRLRVLARNTIGMNIHVKLFKLPINNVTMYAQLFRKSHDYRPFFYNTTVDFCYFMKHPNQFLFWKYVLQALAPYTNANHTCPYDHDIIIKNMVLTNDMLRYIPFPSSDYMISVKIAVNNEMKVWGKVYIRVNE